MSSHKDTQQGYKNDLNLRCLLKQNENSIKRDNC